MYCLKDYYNWLNYQRNCAHAVTIANITKGDNNMVTYSQGYESALSDAINEFDKLKKKEGYIETR